MKLILERWRLYENQVLKDEIERDFRILLINWVSKYSPGSPEGKKLEAWFNSNKKPQFSKFSYDQVYGIMVQALEQIPIIPLESGEELFPGVVQYSEDSQGIAAYGAPPQKSPYDKQRFGIFVINNKNWKQSNTGKKKNVVVHESNHWLDWFKGFMGANAKFASEDNTDLTLLKTIFLDRPVNGHGLNQEQLQYFGSKKEQRAYLKQYEQDVGSSLSENDIFNICTAQREIVASGGFWSLTQEKYKDILSRVNFRPELILYFNCSRASQKQVIDAARQLVKVDRGRRTMVAEQETPANPKKMKKYLDSHPYMEPDGLQEDKGHDISAVLEKYGPPIPLRDEKGYPLMVYQGNDSDSIHDTAKGQEAGIYLTPRRGYAANYGRNVHETYVALTNPLEVENKGEISPKNLTREDIKKLVSQGYDGIIVKNPGSANDKASEIVLFSSDSLINSVSDWMNARDDREDWEAEQNYSKMEPDGLQEEWSKSERDKRKSKCANPKGFTMKQFCKNQRTRSKKGQKTN